MSAQPFVRVYAVVNWRLGRLHGVTCNVNQSAAWVVEICDQYDDPLAATQTVDLVYPDEMEIPFERNRTEDRRTAL